MPNVLLTQSCIRSCPYCFAKRHMAESSPDDILSWENLIYIADFLQSSGERVFRLLGGEPTLHPDFNAMVLYLLERQFNVNVFTSGVMSDAVLNEMAELFGGLPPERLSIICNLNDPAKTRTPLAEQESIRRFLRLMGERVVPGFNIYRVDFDLDFLFQYINEFGLQRHIRVGIAHPIAGKKNLYIRINQIDEVIARLFSYAPMFERMRVKPGLDCGFPICRFSDEQLAWLYRHAGAKSEFGCGPVVDIGPDMSVWPCFPLSSFHKRSLFEFNSMREIIEYYQQIHRAVRTEVGGLYDDCDLCRHREDGICLGGCLAHSLSKFQNEAPVRMREIYEWDTTSSSAPRTRPS
jgi:radical SAM protein with 4Fe4S-binding SPASM domain